MNNGANPNKNNQKWGNLLYIIIPVLMILALSYFVGQENKKEPPKYYEIVQQFNRGEVTEYSLNLANGVMEYKLKTTEEGKSEKYTVPNVDIFLNDVHNAVREYNIANPDAPIKYNYVRGTNSYWLTSMIPSLILIVLLAGFIRIAMPEQGHKPP